MISCTSPASSSSHGCFPHVTQRRAAEEGPFPAGSDMAETLTGVRHGFTIHTHRREREAELKDGTRLLLHTASLAPAITGS